MSHLIRNSRFQKALLGQSQRVPPIWLMRQAGRYHRHCQNLRSRHSFMELCKNPDLAAEVAWGPIQDFDFDVAILFSDLLFPLEALGMGLEYSDQKGPQLGWHLQTEKDFQRWKSTAEARSFLGFQKEALRKTRDKLPSDKSLIGFVGGPWTLFSYATQGKHEGGLLGAKRLFMLFETFQRQMEELLEENIRLQLEGGAEIVMIFDTAAGELSFDWAQKWILPSLERLSLKFPRKLAYYSRGTSEAFLLYIFQKQKDSRLELAGLGVDHRLNLPSLLLKKNKEFQLEEFFLQGNFDQALLHLEPLSFHKVLQDFLLPFRELSPQDRSGWVCGLGHGVLPKTPEENVKYFVDFVRKFFQE